MARASSGDGVSTEPNISLAGGCLGAGFFFLTDFFGAGFLLGLAATGFVPELGIGICAVAKPVQNTTSVRLRISLRIGTRPASPSGLSYSRLAQMTGSIGAD